ncbi:NUDIX hydrolase [Deltaproteobacteria bacterium]|nr:NUDIX hydrolase [Deltaproteobacteria bacterium]
MQVVYANQEFPESWSFAVFLAGPTPRDEEQPSWRPEAIAWLEKFAAEKGLSDIVVFVPEDEHGKWEHSYIDQVEWEQRGLHFADVVMFWVPRDLTWMPGFTTNVEFGYWAQSAKVVLGHPKEAPKTRYLDWMADHHSVPVADTLMDTCQQVVELWPGEGTDRSGGQRYVPLHVWNTQMYQDWYAALVKAGNRLDEAQVRWVFHMPKLGKVFSWVLWVKVWIAKEERYKENEWVFARSDISTIVMYRSAVAGAAHEPGEWPVDELLDTEVILVREFRSPVRNDAGFVYEVPGGSSPSKDQDPLQVASEEVHEETGLIIPKDRFVALGSRQLAATLSAHHAHLFAVELTEEEMVQAKALALAGEAFGLEEDSERTYVEVRTVREMVHTELVDWSMLGMIFKGLLR